MQRGGWIDQAILVVVALVVHGLLLLDTGIYFDDWVVYTYVVKGDWELLSSIVRDRGIAPVEQYYWWMFRGLPVFAYKAAVFIMIIGMGWVAMRLGRTSTFLSRQESLLVALFMVSYSGFQTWVLFCTSHYVFFYCLFLIGALLALQAERERGWRHWLRRAAALCLFAVSYGLNSLMVLTIVFGLVLLLFLKKLHRLTGFRLVVTYLPRRLDCFALPIVYWFAVKWLIPVQGLLTTYNQFLTSPAAIVTNLQQFAINAVAMQFRSGVAQLWEHAPAIAAPVAVGILVWWRSRHRADPPPAAPTPLLAVAVMWLVSTMFAYAVVGKPATPAGWDTRHALLVSFPLGVAIVALARLLQPSGATHVSLAGSLAMMALSAGMAISTIETHVDLQARAVKDQSVMQQLVAMPQARETSVFWVQDRLPQPFSESYRYYEWAGMFEHAFGDQTRAGFDRQVYRGSEVLTNDRRYFIARYRLKDFDPAGCQAEMTIDWGRVEAWGLTPPPSSWPLVRTYQRLRLFGAQERLTRFLNEVTDVRLEPLSAPEAVHCARRS